METVDFSASGFQIIHPEKKKGAILREKRVTQNLTQQQVADKAGIRLQQYQRLENNERNIMTCRVIEALGMDISDFYHGEYIFGEEVYMDKEGMKYVKTGRLTSEDVV